MTEPLFDEGFFAAFMLQVAAELDRAHEKHRERWPLTTLETWALILGEETGEAQQAVLNHVHFAGRAGHITIEAVQVAAMAFKLWEASQGLLPVLDATDTGTTTRKEQ